MRRIQLIIDEIAESRDLVKAQVNAAAVPEEEEKKEEQ